MEWGSAMIGETDINAIFNSHRLTRKAVDPVAIALANLSFSYPDKPNVLHDLHLDIHQGERVGIVGYNGCGKTTLFMLICGVLTPSAGSVALLGEPVAPGQFRPDIGLVFQNPDDQLFSATVWEDVAFAPENMGLSPEEVEARVRSAMQLTGTEALHQRPPHHLSGGEKRMVAIAGVLAMLPQVMIYDEPTANLDLRARRRLIRFLQSSPQTFLTSSHDLEFILEVCDRVIVLNEGRIAADGDPAQVMRDRFLMEASGLEVPHSLTHTHRSEP
ncbi:MAG: ABC transporter ATP-binding protein [Cyanobacteria bacterium J06638_22]